MSETETPKVETPEAKPTPKPKSAPALVAAVDAKLAGRDTDFGALPIMKLTPSFSTDKSSVSSLKEASTVFGVAYKALVDWDAALEAEKTASGIYFRQSCIAATLCTDSAGHIDWSGTTGAYEAIFKSRQKRAIEVACTDSNGVVDEKKVGRIQNAIDNFNRDNDGRRAFMMEYLKSKDASVMDGSKTHEDGSITPGAKLKKALKEQAGFQLTSGGKPVRGFDPETFVGTGASARRIGETRYSFESRTGTGSQKSRGAGKGTPKGEAVTKTPSVIFSEILGEIARVKGEKGKEVRYLEPQAVTKWLLDAEDSLFTSLFGPIDARPKVKGRIPRSGELADLLDRVAAKATFMAASVRSPASTDKAKFFATSVKDAERDADA